MFFHSSKAVLILMNPTKRYMMRILSLPRDVWCQGAQTHVPQATGSSQLKDSLFAAMNASPVQRTIFPTPTVCIKPKKPV